MPDAKWTPWKEEEETRMDAELRNEFARVHEKLDRLTESSHQTALEATRTMALLDASSKSAHKRLDEMKDEINGIASAAHEAGGPGARGWVAIIVTFLTAAGGAVAAWFSGKQNG